MVKAGRNRRGPQLGPFFDTLCIVYDEPRCLNLSTTCTKPIEMRGSSRDPTSVITQSFSFPLCKISDLLIAEDRHGGGRRQASLESEFKSSGHRINRSSPSRAFDYI